MTTPSNDVLDLNGPGWSLRLGEAHDRGLGDPRDERDPPAGLARREVPATVPGCVHTDLLAAGEIDDPYVADNELKLLWIGRCDWTYSRRFAVSSELLSRRHIELCFDGLDTVAEVRVNDTVVGQSQDMHLRQRFEVKGALREGENELMVRFAAPVPHATRERDRLGDLPHVGEGSNPRMPHNFIRKMACNFGWDWGPNMATCGLWRPVRIEAWDTARLGDVRPIVTQATAERATVEVHADVIGEGTVVAKLIAPDGRGIEAENLGFVVENPELWWPAGHGEQPLYTLNIELRDEAGNVLDSRQHRIGLRTSRLVTEPDPEPVEGLGQGECMYLEINGRRIWCKGANWIPDDCFPTRVTPERYRQRITQARDANMNMLRVWGGGLYESHDFYEICDELGVMVWQDFLLACAAYSEEEPIRSLVEAEAKDNVSRLARHPSLVLWNGCNENLMGWNSWSYEGKKWPDYIGDRGWGRHYYFSVFPETVSQLDPGKPYWPASPYSGDPDIDARPANLNEYGNRHVWDVWHGPGHYRNYLAHFPRFASEFGFHGPPTWPTIARAVPEEQRQWDSPIMRLHNKNGGGNRDGQRQTTERMADDFDVPAELDDWLYLAQVMQARALDMGVRWFRSLSPWNGGALYWQLNDCWPVFSWSAIDGDGWPKPLLHVSRRFFAPRIVSIGPRTPVKARGWGDDVGPLAVYLHNDHALQWRGNLSIKQMNLKGNTLAAETKAVEIAPGTEEKIDLPASMTDQPDTFLVAELEGGERGFWWFAPDKDVDYPEPDFDAEVADDGRRVTLTAKTLLRDTCLFADRLHPDAVASDACVTLLPGERFTFTIDSPEPLDREALLKPPVLRFTNRVGRSK